MHESTFQHLLRRFHKANDTATQEVVRSDSLFDLDGSDASRFFVSIKGLS